MPDIWAYRHTSRIKVYSRSSGECRGPYPNRMHLQFLFQVRNGDMPQICSLWSRLQKLSQVTMQREDIWEQDCKGRFVVMTTLSKHNFCPGNEACIDAFARQQGSCQLIGPTEVYYIYICIHIHIYIYYTLNH